MVDVVKEPYAGVLVIFFKWHCVAVGDIDGAFEGATEENADDSLPTVLSDAVVVVDDAK
jgi:hypothetical protein